MPQGNNQKREGSRSHELYLLQAINRIANGASLDDLLNEIQGTTDVHNYINTTAAGTVPAGTKRGSITNIGSETGTYLGADIPAGVTIPWGETYGTQTYGELTYDPTGPGAGTTFLIEYTI